MIGILKTLGMKNRDMQIIFLMQASRIIVFGLIGGNLLGLGLAWIQYHFKLIQLNEADYYLSIAPIEFSFSAIIMINIFTLIVIMAFLIIPSMIISRISPVKTIEYN